MSNSVRPEVEQDTAEGEPTGGPNLPVYYSLIALALVVAIFLALMIVIPFHHRH
jgi:hypothetical protein